METGKSGVGTMHVRGAHKILGEKAERKRELWTLRQRW